MLARTRRVVQVLFLLGCTGLFLAARYPLSSGFPVDVLVRLSPLAPLIDVIQSWEIPWHLWPALVILALTPFLGRFFCGWICPLGTTIDVASHVLKSPPNRTTKIWNGLQRVKFAVLVACLLLAVFSVHVWGYLDPLAIFNRTLTVLVYPLFTLGVERTLLAGTTVPGLTVAVSPVYESYKTWIMPEGQAHFQQVFWVAVFIVAVFGAEKITRRFWCRYLCPAGALLGFLGQFRMFERIVGPECPVCNKCQTECKMNAIPRGDVVHTSKVECIDCFNCGATCPPKIDAITYRWRWKPYHTPVDMGRRHLLGSSVAGFATLGLVKIGLDNRNEKGGNIRPPGALAEEEFQDRCIRCMECVRMCTSNGGCLQPAAVTGNILDLWLPVAVMREGYCEYNCNLCTQVCPTQAILPLTLADKQKTVMGLAHFDKNLCIPYAQNSDCLVCEEHCPTPDKAIKFDIREVRLPTGEVKRIKYPQVIRELCIGCGICENKCPLHGAPGVFVTPERQQRPSRLQPVEATTPQPADDPYGS